jgi:hypothetical protein
MTKKPVVWVLTREHNEYDQHGAYFEAVFSSQPTLLQLAEWFSSNGGQSSSNTMGAVAFLEHLRQGGGRRKNEDVWYNLEKVEMI